VDDLPPKLLIGMDVIGSEGMLINTSTGQVTLPRCEGAAFETTIKRRQPRFQSRDVRAAKRTTIHPRSVQNVPVAFGEDLPFEVDFAFESTFAHPSARGYHHVTDANFSFVQVRNDTDTPFTINNFTKLGRLDEWDT